MDIKFLLVGLIIGVIIGYCAGYLLYQPQISQLQASLSNAQSDLAASQSEVQSLQTQLVNWQHNVTDLETQVSQLQGNLSSLETQLEEKETEYNELSTECDNFKSNVSSIVNSLNKKIILESRITMMWSQALRGQNLEFSVTLLGLGSYVDAVGDSQLSLIWDEVMTYLNGGQASEANLKLADLIERNSVLIQTDMTELITILND